MKTSDIDKKFDNGEDISAFFDWENAQRWRDPKRTNVDFPFWMVQSIDREAKRLGVTRQALIKVWIADKLASLEKK